MESRISGPALKVGNKTFPLADLSPEALAYCRQIEFCEQQMARLQRELTLLQQVRGDAVVQLPLLLPGTGQTLLRQSRRRLQWPSAPASRARRY